MIPYRAEVWLVIAYETYTPVWPIDSKKDLGFEMRVWEQSKGFAPEVESFEQYLTGQLEEVKEWSAQFSFTDESIGRAKSGEDLFFRLHIEFVERQEVE